MVHVVVVYVVAPAVAVARVLVPVLRHARSQARYVLEFTYGQFTHAMVVGAVQIRVVLLQAAM